jgi:phospholipase A-2-activating protein
VWRDSKCIATLKGHTDTVRSLCFHASLGLISASHDLTIRLWDANTGQCVKTIDPEHSGGPGGHSAIIYAVDASIDGGLLATGSEDSTARLWTPDGQCLQALEMPGCVWDVKFTPAGELLCACSDGKAYLYTSDPAAAAEPDVAAALQARLEERREAAKVRKNQSMKVGLFISRSGPPLSHFGLIALPL